MSTCPSGHDSTADDYCDVCGLPIPPGGAEGTGVLPTVPAAAPATQSCPHCSTANPADALFCEACGYDFTTGSLPRPLDPPDGVPAPAPVPPAPADPNPSPALEEQWVAEIWIDPDWYADQLSTDPMPSPGLPTVVALRHRSVLIGRASRSRGINPDIDLSSDNGISRRHAQLTTDGTRWFVEDLGSSNGTFVGSAVGPLPTAPVPVGQRHEIDADERLYLGAWTRLVVRKAAPGEV